jgi:general secretion pathway protein L
MSVLLLFPVADDPTAFDWARPERRGGRPAIGRATPDTPVSLRAGERAILVAPGEDVALLAVELPVRAEGPALAAARFAIEDDLAQAIEDVEVVLGPRGKERMREALVVARDRLEGWRAGLAAIGVETDMVVPDYAAIPIQADTVRILDLGDKLLVRGRGLGFAVDPALAPAMIAATLARRPGEAVTLSSDRPDAVLPPAAREGRQVDVTSAPSVGALLGLVESAVVDGTALNLARVWRTPSGAPVLALKEWRAAAGIAAAAALAFSALIGAQTITMKAEAAQSRVDAERLLVEAFPDIGRVINPRAQLRERLGDGGGGPGAASFLELSSLLADGAREAGGVEIESIRFGAGQGRLSASIVYAGYGDVERLRAAVAARGGRLVEGAAVLRGDRMSGEIEVARP